MKKLGYFAAGSCVGFVLGAAVIEALTVTFIRPETAGQILKDLEERATKARLANEYNKEFFKIVKDQ